MIAAEKHYAFLGLAPSLLEKKRFAFFLRGLPTSLSHRSLRCFSSASLTISTITLAKLPLNGVENLTTTALSLAGLLFSIHVLQTKNLTENMHQGMLKATDPNVKGTVFWSSLCTVQPCSCCFSLITLLICVNTSPIIWVLNTSYINSEHVLPYQLNHLLFY